MDWIGLGSEKFALRCLRIGVEPAFMNLHWMLGASLVLGFRVAYTKPRFDIGRA
jgi:hypothetical protein